MSRRHELCHRIVHTLARLVTVSHIAQLSHWAWLTVKILQSQAVTLTQAGKLTTNVSVTWTEAADQERVAMVSGPGYA